LWDDEAGFYCDRTMDGTPTGVRAVSGFLPLLLDDVPQDRVDRLVSQLRDPDAFWTSFPIPSVSVDDPKWSTDMWRGATWLNFDYLVMLGLVKAGYPDLAAALRSRWLHYVQHYYESYGVIFEFYDAKDEVPPVACDRKGPRREPYDLRVKMDSIRDYHWSAALTARVLWDQLNRRDFGS
jgi:neutral trehalase